MKGIVAILRSSFISPEFVVSLGGVMLCFLFPDWFLWLSQRIGQQADVLKYAGLLPAGVVAYNLKAGRSILFPYGDKRAVLQAWDRYWEIKCGVVVGMIYNLLFAVAGIGTLLFDWKNSVAFQSAVLLTSLAGAVTVSASLFHANIRIEEVFREHAKQRAPG